MATWADLLAQFTARNVLLRALAGGDEASVLGPRCRHCHRRLHTAQSIECGMCIACRDGGQP